MIKTNITTRKNVFYAFFDFIFWPVSHMLTQRGWNLCTAACHKHSQSLQSGEGAGSISSKKPPFPSNLKTKVLKHFSQRKKFHPFGEVFSYNIRNVCGYCNVSWRPQGAETRQFYYSISDINTTFIP